MTKFPRVGVWFAAATTIFFTRAILFSTWQSRAPEVQAMLHLNTAEMGLMSMLYPTGGLVGLLFANSVNNRFGSSRVTIAGYSLAAAALASLSFTVPAGLTFASAALLFVIGVPMGVADFVGNFEGTGVDSMSKRSLLPGIHAVFGVGMMGAAGFASLLLSHGVSLATNYLIIAVLVAIPSIWAGTVFPRRRQVHESQQAKAEHKRLTARVWREGRTWMLASIAFAFAMAELGAGTWVPISLSQSGFDHTQAAAAFGWFWVFITLGRTVGGGIVDRIGIRATIVASVVMCTAGIVLFIFNGQLHQPYLALFLWGFGMANGIPLAINGASDASALSAARINMIITVAYAAMLSVGPSLGAIGQLIGINAAFALPVLLLVFAAFASRVIAPRSASA
ncbi:MAG: MFS transporter [Micrococcales bacterium]